MATVTLRCINFVLKHYVYSFTGGVDCDFDLGLCPGWKNDVDFDDFDWTPQQGPTQTDGTGPDFDHTSGDGQYMFIEASKPRKKEDLAILVTPEIQWLDNTVVCFNFW